MPRADGHGIRKPGVRALTQAWIQPMAMTRRTLAAALVGLMLYAPGTTADARPLDKATVDARIEQMWLQRRLARARETYSIRETNNRAHSRHFQRTHR